MKKLTLIATALLFTAALMIPAYAQGKEHKKTEANLEITRGTVMSLDAVKKEIVVKDEKGTEKTFTVSEKALAGLKVADKVRVKTKIGSSVAESVKVIKPEPKKTTK